MTITSDPLVLKVGSVEVSAGRALWITGENGAGKSMLLRELARRLEPTRELRYFHPSMAAPQYVTVEDWMRFSERMGRSRAPVLDHNDPLLPHLDQRALLTKLSTGEAKRLLLWSLLRLPSSYTILDEPYEHLSANAKSRLSEIVAHRARYGIVVIATNQPVPENNSSTLSLDA